MEECPSLPYRGGACNSPSGSAWCSHAAFDSGGPGVLKRGKTRHKPIHRRQPVSSLRTNPPVPSQCVRHRGLNRLKNNSQPEGTWLAAWETACETRTRHPTVLAAPSGLLTAPRPFIPRRSLCAWDRPSSSIHDYSISAASLFGINAVVQRPFAAGQTARPGHRQHVECRYCHRPLHHSCIEPFYIVA